MVKITIRTIKILMRVRPFFIYEKILLIARPGNKQMAKLMLKKS